MKIEIPCTERCRKYGYLYWTKDINSLVVTFFAGKLRVKVSLGGYMIGEKKVDYKYRRVSLGMVSLKLVPDHCTHFCLSFNKDGILRIEYK
jgi:hypothetical protein